MKAKARAEAKQADAEQAESEGRNHPGVPDEKAQRKFTDPDSRIMPGPGGRDFQQPYNCQAVVDSAHQVIAAARSTNQPSDKGQAVAMVEDAIGMRAQSPRSYPPTPGTTRRGRWRNCTSWEWTRSSHRRGPATAGWFHRRPGAAYPRECRPGTGCGASCARNGGGSDTPCGWRRRSRCSDRSSGAVVSGSSCCGIWRRSTGNGY